MITLYQMPISHFCEKVRWALAYKRLPHKSKTLLPGLHARTAKKMTGQTSVPIIKDDQKIVHNSSDIIDYLDSEYPRFELTPENEAERKLALEWESWADQEIGIAVRVVAYSALLDRPDILIPIMGQDGPWYRNLYLKKAFPKIATVLRSKLKLDEERVAASKACLHDAIAKIKAAQPNNEPLLASGFSRADIAVASLWAPLFEIGKFGVHWPETMPLAYQGISKEFSEIKPWVLAMYSNYR